jgi:hypothetical protein
MLNFIFNRIVNFKNGSFKVVAAWLLPLVLALTLFTPASAQLRSGRVQRDLYQESIRPQANVREPEIALASHDAQAKRSVGGGDGMVVAASGIHDAGGGGECEECGVSDCGGGCAAMSLGCGSTGCDAMGCDACCGGYSEIAPTCTSYCAPGCGPLMALWQRLSVRAEAPMYWRRAAAPPALVTTSDVGTASDVAGELGLVTTRVLLGDSRLNEDLNVGARITLSTWLGQDEQYGLMFRYWNAGDQDDTFNFNSNSFPILARPFLNTTVSGTPTNDTLLVAFTDLNVAPTLTGNIQVITESSVDGLDLTLRRLLYKDRFTRVDWLYGYQHVAIDEGLRISSTSEDTAAGATISVNDSFATQNDFHGVSYGISSTRRVACWKMETLFRLGAGNLRRQVNIVGSTTTTSGGLSNTVAEGLMARDTNSRPYVDDTFVILPEVGINFAYSFNPGLDFTVGYNYMHIPKVAQASQQINDDLAVNLSDPITGTLDPALNFDERTYWLHSLGLGLQLRY